MTTFFWVAETTNFITLIVALAALLVVVWLGPRRWVNLSFATFLAAIITWMGNSIVLRLLVNVPSLGGNWQAMMNLIALGFALVGLTLFWFVESFYPFPRRWRLAANIMAVFVYGAFLLALRRDAIATNPRLDAAGGLSFDITGLGTALSAFQYVYNGIVIAILVRHRAWRERWHLVAGALIVIATTVMALLSPAIAVQTYTVAFGTLFMAYELIKQQLFNPLLTMNQRLEAEVAARTGELKHSLAEQERVRSELAIAREIQLSLLPASTPDRPNVQVAGRSIPAQEVGGDFYAYHVFADGRLGVAVGDVSGKGIPAALLMALSLRTFEMLVEEHRDQGALLNAFNQALAPRLLQSRLNTAFLSLVVDPGGREVAVANAGLIAPLLWRKGEVSYVENFGLPLGASGSVRYAEARVRVEEGDHLLLISDGIVEAMNLQGEMWGFERLEAAFQASGAGGPVSIIETILAQVAAFTDPAPPHDDMTLVVLQLR